MKICLVRVKNVRASDALGVFLQHRPGDNSLQVFREVQAAVGSEVVGEPLALPLEWLANAAQRDPRVLNDVNRLLQEVVANLNR